MILVLLLKCFAGTQVQFESEGDGKNENYQDTYYPRNDCVGKL